MEFAIGERVRLKGAHLFDGRIYDREATDGEVGVVDGKGATHYHVQWVKGNTSNVDASCLVSADAPTNDELRAVYRSLGVPAPGLAETQPEPDAEVTAVAAFLQGMLAAECAKMARAIKPALKIAAVEQAADEYGNYQKHFTVITESGIRLRVQITPEEGA